MSLQIRFGSFGQLPNYDIYKFNIKALRYMKSSQNKFIGLEKDGLTYISDSISTLGE